MLRKFEGVTLMWWFSPADAVVAKATVSAMAPIEANKVFRCMKPTPVKSDVINAGNRSYPPPGEKSSR